MYNHCINKYMFLTWCSDGYWTTAGCVSWKWIRKCILLKIICIHSVGGGRDIDYVLNMGH